MALSVVTPPTALAVPLADAKTYLRVDGTNEDSLIAGLIQAATDHVERVTRRTMIYTTYRLRLDSFPDGPIELPRSPAVDITAGANYAYDMPSIDYIDNTGAADSLTKDVDYELDLSENPPQLHLPPLEYWPLTQAGKAKAVTVDFVAGYGPTAATVPALLKQAILLLVGHWYENREAVGSVGSEMALAVDSILKIYRTGDYQ
jgi:uncharacterized phiE125 gp8 family phage protein